MARGNNNERGRRRKMKQSGEFITHTTTSILLSTLSAIPLDLRFLFGLVTTQLPKPKPRSHLGGILHRSLDQNGLTHLAVGGSDSHSRDQWLIAQFTCNSDGNRHPVCAVCSFVAEASDHTAVYFVRISCLIWIKGLTIPFRVITKG